MERVPPFNPQQLEAIAKILADTSTGVPSIYSSARTELD